MKNSQSKQEKQFSGPASHESPVADSGSVSATDNGSKKISRKDIELVQNLIERCLQLYMNKNEVVKTLLTRAQIDPGFTALVWQKLEEENADFFRAYYIRLKLKKQILLFNHLLEHQCHLMKYPMPPKVPWVPIQNGIQPVPGQPHLDSMACGISGCYVVNGVPAPINFHPLWMNSGNESMKMKNNAVNVSPVIPMNGAMSSMSEMPLSPTSVSSSGHFPFTASDISGIETDTSALDSAFTSDVAGSVGLQLAADGGAGRPLDLLHWNFSLCDITTDLSNLADLGALGNYPGSPFVLSDSEILLDSTDQEDIVEDFFVDSVPEPTCSQSDDEKS